MCILINSYHLLIVLQEKNTFQEKKREKAHFFKEITEKMTLFFFFLDLKSFLDEIIEKHPYRFAQKGNQLRV